MYNYQTGPINHFLVDVLGLFTYSERAAVAGRHGAHFALDRDHGGLVGPGYHSVFFLAGLAAILLALPEAARIDGANEWQVFWHVTLPRLQPIMMILVVLRFGTSTR